MKTETPNNLIADRLRSFFTEESPAALDDTEYQAALLHDALRVAAGLPPLLPPIDLFKRDRPCRGRA